MCALYSAAQFCSFGSTINYSSGLKMDSEMYKSNVLGFFYGGGKCWIKVWRNTKFGETATSGFDFKAKDEADVLDKLRIYSGKKERKKEKFALICTNISFETLTNKTWRISEE